MQGQDYRAALSPTSELVADTLSHWQNIRDQIDSPEQVRSFEECLTALTSRLTAFVEIGGQQVQQVGQKQRGRETSLSR